MAAKTRQQTLEALGNYQRQDGRDLGVEGIGQLLESESDRGIVVIFGSFIEDALRTRILLKLGQPSPAAAKNLTRNGGALSNWAQLISMAVVLGVIDEADTGLFECLKAMRNACAHSRKHIDFETPELLSVFYLMVDQNTAERIARLSREHRRMIFVLVCSCILDRVNGQPFELAMYRMQTGLDQVLAGEPLGPLPERLPQLSSPDGDPGQPR